MKQIDIESLKHLLKEMEIRQKEHPKATVLFDLERGQILITYPLPPDF